MSQAWSILIAPRRGGWPERLDPRAKLAWFLSCFFLVVTLRTPPGLGSLALAVLAVAALGGVLRGVARALSVLLGFIALVTVLNVAYFGPVSGLLAGLKFALAIAVFSAFLQTTPPEELSAALVRLGVPFHFAFTLAAGTRFVPTIAREVGEILDAYRARGVPFEESPLGRARTYPRILVPLVVSTIARSVRLAEAMEARAFGYSPSRTPYRDLRLGRGDWLALALALALVALALAVEVVVS